MSPSASRKLKLLSFNIQHATSVEAYAHYVTRGLQHVLPHSAKRRNLKAITELVQGYDIVGLQEADSGSLRSDFINQVEKIAEGAEFPYWTHQTNRRVASIAAPSNGLLSRLEPLRVVDHRLPSTIPGRRTLEAHLGEGESGLRILVAHLALSPRARRSQFDYLIEVIGHAPHVVLMGDFNCPADGRECERLYAHTRLQPPPARFLTYPSWKPTRSIDHVLVSKALKLQLLDVVKLMVSDHLPLAAEVLVPLAALR